MGFLRSLVPSSRLISGLSVGALVCSTLIVLNGLSGPAQASSETFHLFGQVNNNSLSGAQDLGTGRNVAMTVSPASPAANAAIEVQVTSSNLTLCNGPAAAIGANAEELDAVISLDGTTYVLRGPQNTGAIPASRGAQSYAPNCAYSVVNPGWVVSSTAGNSSGTSLNNLTLAPTTSGTYTLGLKVNGTSFTTAAIAFDADGNTIKTAITTAATTAGVTGVSFAVFGNVASANRLVMAYTNPTGAGAGNPYLTSEGYVATALPTLEATNATSNATLAPTTPVATTTGIGATTFTQADGSVSAGVALKAPTTPGDYEIKLKALALNSLGTSTGLYDNFDQLINIDSNGACFNSAGCAGTAGPGGIPASGAGAGSFYNDDPSKYITFGTPVSISVAGLSKPATPAKPTAVAGDTKATVSWTAPGDGGSAILSYEVTSSPEGKTCAPASLTPPLTCDVTGLTNGTPYTFSVTATNGQGTSDASSASNSVTPSAPTKPAAPTSVDAQQLVDGSLSVSWLAPSDDGGSQILSYTARVSEPTNTQFGECTVDGSTTSCDIGGLNNGTTYTVTVVATNAIGTSDASDPSQPVTVSSSDGSPTSVVPRVYCQPNNVGLQPTPATYSNWPISISVDPGAGRPGSLTSVSVQVNASPNNGPAVSIKPGQYQMQAQVEINGNTYVLDGPSNSTVVQTGKPIFIGSELPTVATGDIALPATQGDYAITIKQLIYKNVVSGDGSPPLTVPAGEINAGEPIFTQKCNASSTAPAESPQGFISPTVSVSSTLLPTDGKYSLVVSPAGPYKGGDVVTLTARGFSPNSPIAVGQCPVGRPVTGPGVCAASKNGGSRLLQANEEGVATGILTIIVGSIENSTPPVESCGPANPCYFSATNITNAKETTGDFYEINYVGSPPDGGVCPVSTGGAGSGISDSVGGSSSYSSSGGGNGGVQRNFVGADLSNLDLSYCDLANADFTGADLSNTNLTGAKLRFAKFSGANLTNADFSNADLYRISSGAVIGNPSQLPVGWGGLNGYLVGPTADLRFAVLHNLDLTGFDIRGVLFDGAELSESNFEGLDLCGSSFIGANLTAARLVAIGQDNPLFWSGCIPLNLSDATLTGANLARGNFSRANFEGAGMAASTVVQTNFQDATLKGADLSGANMYMASVDNANFESALFSRVKSGMISGNALTLPSGWYLLNGYFVGPDADLVGADLHEQNLTFLDLHQALLNRANLRGSSFAFADLSAADLRGSDLRDVFLSGADLGRALLQGVRSGGISGSPLLLPPEWRLISGALTTATVSSSPSAVAGVVGDRQVVVSWVAPSSDGGAALTGYVVSSGGVAVCSVTVVAPAVEPATSCTVSGLVNGTGYSFTVRAFNAVGGSVASDVSGVLVPRSVPDAPSGVVGVAGDRQVSLSWDAPSSDGGSALTGYKVFSAGVQVCSVGVVIPALAPAPSCTITGLTNGTPATYSVKATNIAGDSRGSVYSAAIAPRTTPGTPTNLVGSAFNGGVSLNWTAPAVDGGSPINGYVVTTGGVTACSVVLSPPALSPEPRCVAAGLVNGQTYTFVVKAVNAAGSSLASLPSPGLTPFKCPSLLDGAVSVTPGPGVDWSGCALAGAKLAGAALYYSDLRGADLSRADLSRTNLYGSNLAVANLRGANLKDARLEGANLLRADVTDAQWGNTTCTDGTISDEHIDGSCVRPVDIVGPTATMTSPTATFTTSQSISVAWKATDAETSVASTDVSWQRMPVGGGSASAWTYPAAWQATSARTTVFTNAGLGFRYCFRTRARDIVGNVSPWSASACTNVPIDDRSLVATGGWSRPAVGGWIRGTGTLTNSPGEYLVTSRTTNVRHLALVATKCSTCGSVLVYVGSTYVGTASLYTSGTSKRALITLPKLSSVKSGKVTLVVNSSGKAVRIDGLAVTSY